MTKCTAGCPRAVGLSPYLMPVATHSHAESRNSWAYYLHATKDGIVTSPERLAFFEENQMLFKINYSFDKFVTFSVINILELYIKYNHCLYKFIIITLLLKCTFRKEIKYKEHRKDIFWLKELIWKSCWRMAKTNFHFKGSWNFLRTTKKRVYFFFVTFCRLRNLIYWNPVRRLLKYWFISRIKVLRSLRSSGRVCMLDDGKMNAKSLLQRHNKLPRTLYTYYGRQKINYTGYMQARLTIEH